MITKKFQTTKRIRNCRDEKSDGDKKRVIITVYNATKGAIDSMDRMTENYLVARKSFRWPLSVFYSTLNIRGINAKNKY